jgi:hypothetical protein
VRSSLIFWTSKSESSYPSGPDIGTRPGFPVVCRFAGPKACAQPRWGRWASFHYVPRFAPIDDGFDRAEPRFLIGLTTRGPAAHEAKIATGSGTAVAQYNKWVFATITAEGESEKPLSVTVGSREKPPAGNSWLRSHAVRPMIIGIVAVASLRLG